MTGSFAGAATPKSATAGNGAKVTYLSRHTTENPYDVRLTTWCGGLAGRVEIIPHTSKPLVVAYNTGDLHGAKITGKAPSRVGFTTCKNGKTTILFDVLSLDGCQKSLTNLVTKRSDITEWRMAVDLQSRGQLNTKTFAHNTVSHDYYNRATTSGQSSRLATSY